jgi:hypothetical protein
VIPSLQLTVPLNSPKLLLLELVEATAANTVVRAVPGIERVHLLDPEKGSTIGRLQTEGINFSGLWEQVGVGGWVWGVEGAGRVRRLWLHMYRSSGVCVVEAGDRLRLFGY